MKPSPLLEDEKDSSSNLAVHYSDSRTRTRIKLLLSLGRRPKHLHQIPNSSFRRLQMIKIYKISKKLLKIVIALVTKVKS